MPSLIDHADVLERLTGDGLTSLYFRSGAFGFDATSGATTVGWIIEPDSTLRPDAIERARMVEPPEPVTLVKLLRRAWLECLPGDAWVMPASHWAYELDFGSADWLPAALRDVSIDSTTLAHRADGSAIAFDVHEADAFERLTRSLLERLVSSDFTIAFPGHKTVCLLHHHQQLWWQTLDPDIAARLESLA